MSYIYSNSNHITLNKNTPTIVPNTTLQQTSSPDITTVSNTLYNQTLWITQRALSSDHLPIITKTYDMTTDYNKTDRPLTTRVDTIYRRNRVRSRSDHHTHQHTHCQQNFHKHHTDGRQAQHTKVQDA